MRFDISEDQEFFHRTTRTFLEKEASTSETRTLADSDLGYDPAVWSRGCELGWTSLLAPERHGGGSFSSNGVDDLALVCEEFGRHVAAGPLVPVNVVVAALARGGSETLQDELIPALMSGEATAAWAVAEASDTWDGVGLTTTAAVTDDGFVLAGRKRFVEAAPGASHLLVTAGYESGVGQFIVPTDAPGVVVESRRSVDLVRRFADVRFEGVVVGADQVVGTPGDSASEVAYQRDLALALQVAESVGVMDRAFGMTIEYVQDRSSFGRPLASYQALKHRIADMLLALETAKGCAEAAAIAVGSGAPDASRVASVAKGYVGRMAPELVSEAVQLHGGIGVTWEHDLHVLGRRVALNRALYGSPEHHYERVCALGEAS